MVLYNEGGSLQGLLNNLYDTALLFPSRHTVCCPLWLVIFVLPACRFFCTFPVRVKLGGDL